MEVQREENDSETDENDAVIAEEWEYDASVCRRNGMNELHVIAVVNANGTSREIILVNEVFGTACERIDKCKQDGFGELAPDPFIEKMIHHEHLLDGLRREDRRQGNGRIRLE